MKESKELRLLRIVLIPAVLGAYIGYGSGDHPESPSQTSEHGQPKVERIVSPQKSSSLFGDFDLFSSGSLAKITPTAKTETATATPVPAPNPVVSEFIPTPQPQPDINEVVLESALPLAEVTPQPAQAKEADRPISCESVWEPNLLPTSLSISNIQFESEIQPVYSIPAQEEGRITWPIPDHGIATPVDQRRFNSVYIFGHSDWETRSSFANIEYLNVDDPIIVRNEANQPFCFMVSGFALAEKLQDSYLGGFSEPTVVLQTTARYEGTWILNKKNILAKVGHEEQPASVGNLAFLVFAKKK